MNVPICDPKTGMLLPVWQDWLNKLYQRVGGAEADTNTELFNLAGGTTADVSAHIADPTDAHHASAIGLSAVSGLASTDAQAAIAELEGQVQGKQASGSYLTALTGDVTASGPGSAAATIAAGAVSNSKMANMASHTFKGNNSGSSAAPSDLTASQLTAELNSMVGDSGSGGTKGLVPAPSAGDAAAGKFFKADGTWAAPAGGSSGFSTGDVKLTLKTTADSTWVMMDDGTIGDGSSGATTRANADTSDLFTLLWNNVSDTYAPVSGGRGASAAADFAAHKKISLTKVLGRALAISGAGSGLTSRSLGQTLGEETHVLTTSEMPSHTHTLNAYGNVPAISANFATSSDVLRSSSGGPTNSTGGDGAHNNMQPTSFLNVMVKL
jgi:hypothetical protein